MKFPQLFKHEKRPVLVKPRQDRTQRVLADSLRMLGRALARLADLVEAQRLERAGYEQQGKYLERLDSSGQPGKKS